MESRYKLTMCRLCLCANECFINIFELNDWQGYVAAEVISDLLQFQVTETDGYPHVVCSKCLLKLTGFKLFKECCRKSKVAYDNMFVTSESLVGHKPEMVEFVTFKSEPGDHTDNEGNVPEPSSKIVCTEEDKSHEKCPVEASSDLDDANADGFKEGHMEDVGSGLELCEEDPLGASSPMSVDQQSNLCVFSEEKKKRKSLTLEVKLEVLRRLKDGERQNKVCKALSLAGSTVRTIMKNADKIKEYGKVATPLAAVRLGTRNRSVPMVEMEKLLNVWIEDLIQKRMPVSLLLIQAKAKSLYENLTKDLPDRSNVETFTASRGWFNRFKRRYNLHNLRGESANTDDIAATAFVDEIVETIKKGGYSAQQVFNIDETVLFWKRMPSKMYVSVQEKSMPGFKMSKDRLTLLLGGNASGDFKLKPMIVYHSKLPRALKGFHKQSLPVMWMANKKALVTIQVFEKWFSSYFCPAVQEYCTKNNLDYKALLILDNTPGHPRTSCDLSQNIKVVFLPPNTSSLLQPMDQGVISTFKACYIRKIFAQAVRATDGEDGMNLKEFWNSYNICQAIENIADSWDEISPKIMNAAWKNIWKDCVLDFQGFDLSLKAVNKETIDFARKIGLEKIGPRDIQELIEAHKEELSDKDLMDMQQYGAVEEENVDGDEVVIPAKFLTTTDLIEFLKHIDSACALITENDPDVDRSSKVSRGIRNLVNCYRELLQEIKEAEKHLPLDSFFL